MQYNIDDAKTNFSHLLELVAKGATVVITQDGLPIAELVPCQRKGIQLGGGTGDPLVRPDGLVNDRWWKAMDDQEAEDFLEGR